MKKLLIFALSLALGAIFINSCSEDDPVAPANHFEPEGWVFIDGTGARFMTLFQGSFTDGSAEEFEAPIGGITDHIRIKFFDEDKNEIDPPDETDKTLGWEIEDESIVEVHRHDGAEWEFHLKGLKEGHTEIEFFVMHNNHSDVRTGKIEVHVEEGVASGEPYYAVLFDEESGTKLGQVHRESGSSDVISIPVDTETDHIEVKFGPEDWDGHEDELFTPNMTNHRIRLTSGDTGIFDVVQPEADEPFAFKIVTNKAGKATLSFDLQHLHDTEWETAFTFSGLEISVE